MLTPSSSLAKIAHVSEQGQTWNLFAFHGWISMAEMMLHNAAFFLQIYRLLVVLESVVKPRAPITTQGLGAIGNIFPDVRNPVIADIAK
jgi:hypothetical protein